ncbi:alkaline phosphatase family protein [Arenibacter certesii]|nr:alkaline phosphatase family protein [Arenibacter certesii]
MYSIVGLRKSCLIVLVSIILFAGCKKEGINGIEHVLVIGIDALSPNGIANSHTPNIDALIKEGASTMNARAVLPTSSGPNWASVLMGAGPEQHGITGNDSDPLEPVLPPLVSGDGDKKLFPTIFEVIRKAEPNAELGTIHQWNGVSKYYEPEHLNYRTSTETLKETADLTVNYIKEKKPRYCFVHFDDADQAGHSYGHGSEAYFKAVAKVDTFVGQVLKALDEAGLAGKTLVILTSDHGGIDYGHGGSTPEEMTIPFIIRGPGVKKNYVIKETVNTIDNSPTVAFALGIPAPEAWVGWPVKSAFEGFEEPEEIYETKSFIQAPRIHPVGEHFKPSGGLYISEKPMVRIDLPTDGSEIRYTIDGSEPHAGSSIYTVPFRVGNSVVVKASKFIGDKEVSNSKTAYFRVLDDPEGRGIWAKYYYGENLKKLPDFGKLTQVGETFKTFEITSEDLRFPRGVDQLAMVFTTYFKVEVPGNYTFYISSDDGSKLYVNDKIVVDNDGNHGVKEKNGRIMLAKGKHKLEVQWYNSGGGYGLYTYFEGPGIPKQVLSSDRLYLK